VRLRDGSSAGMVLIGLPLRLHVEYTVRTAFEPSNPQMRRSRKLPAGLRISSSGDLVV
jgi:hypothetical protein